VAPPTSFFLDGDRAAPAVLQAGGDFTKGHVCISSPISDLVVTRMTAVSDEIRP
jgi:hypothetical protein